MRNKQLLTLREHLQLFVSRVDEARSARLFADGYRIRFTINFGRTENPQFDSSAPDEDLVRSFLLTFRQFMSPKEPVYIERIYNLCHRSAGSDTLRKSIDASRKDWKRAKAGIGFGLKFNGQEYQADRAWHLLIDGFYFHSDPIARKTLDSLYSDQRILVKQQFLGFLGKARRLSIP